MAEQAVTDMDYAKPKTKPNDRRGYWRIFFLFVLILAILSIGARILNLNSPIESTRAGYKAVGASAWIAFCHAWQSRGYEATVGSGIGILLLVPLWFAARGKRGARGMLLGICALYCLLAAFDVLTLWCVAHPPPGVQFVSTASQSGMVSGSMTYVFSWADSLKGAIETLLLPLALIVFGLWYRPPYVDEPGDARDTNDEARTSTA